MLQTQTTVESEATSANQPIKLALVSCGLGHVNRGFEVSTARWYEILSKEPELDVKLYTGGKYEGGTEIINIPRDWLLKYVLFPIANINRRRFWEFAYGVEMVTFAFGLIGPLLLWRPDVIWTKEAPFAHVIFFLKYLLGLKYKVIFANGGGFKTDTYKIFDHIQHLQTQSLNEALNSGLDAQKMCIIPNLMTFTESVLDRESLRASFGYAPEDWVVICVAAWNNYHKRIDYLIDEVAGMNDAKVKLLLCGHPEPDAASLKKLAAQKLGNRVKWLTLPHQRIPQALKASDVFVLPSLDELFGSASIEAMMAGLPVVAHLNGATRHFVDGELEITDLSKPGNLTARLSELKKNPHCPKKLASLASSMQARYSPKNLASEFVTMVKTVVKSKK
jgi:glycosyltransferase involved in cell wall biosynthesis